MKGFHKWRNIVYIGSIVIIISLILNIIYAKSKRIDQPIFFEHYYEVSLAENYEPSMWFYYMKNKDDYRDIVDIDFADADGYVDYKVDPYYSWDQVCYDEKYYLAKRKMGRIVLIDDYENIPDQIILGNARIQFNDGTEMKTNLGKIILKKRLGNRLNAKMSSSSSDNTSQTVYKTEDPIVINSITSELAEEVKGFLKVEIVADNKKNEDFLDEEKYDELMHERDEINKGVHWIPVEAVKLPIAFDDNLSIRTAFEVDDPEKRYRFYQMSYCFNYGDAFGEKGVIELLNVRHEFDFSDENIETFLESRGY